MIWSRWPKPDRLERPRPVGAGCAHDHPPSTPGATGDRHYRRILWIALVLNAFMALVEVFAGGAVDSLALWADALDFFGDSANYALSLAVLGAGLSRRARFAFFKGACMAAFGGVILLNAGFRVVQGAIPEAPVMGGIGALALVVNVVVALMLVRHRGGDSNRRAVWLCSRNDAIGNVAVIAAALAVHVTDSRWPDLAVAIVMATLALTGAFAIMRQALGEMASHKTQSLTNA